MKMTNKMAVGACLCLSVAVCYSLAQAKAQSARSGETQASLADGSAINAELDSTLDSKKLKVGDKVSAKVTENVKSADDRTIFPKGTKVIGHVAKVSSKAKGDSESLLAISFDKLVTKDGQETPMNLLIQAMASEPNGGGGMLPMDSGGGTPAGGGNMGGNRPAGGMGGYPSASSPSAPSAYPNSGNPGYGQQGGSNVPNTLTVKDRGVYGLNGMKLGTATENSTEISVVVSDGKNVHLNSGVRLLLVQKPAGATASPSGK